MTETFEEEALKAVFRALDQHQVEYAVFGAIALGLHGLARSTADLDLLALICDLTLATGLEVDVVDLSEAGHTLKRILLRDSLVVYEGAPGATATWRHQTLLITELDHPFFERMQKGFLRRLAKGGKA